MPEINLSFVPPRKVTVVDAVIAGDVLRIVLDGLPALRARDATQALEELRNEHDEFRRLLVSPPRGHAGINACLLLPAFSHDAVRTAIIAPQFGYAPIAGTPLMAAAAVLIETLQIDVSCPKTRVVFDTANGKAEIIATVDNGRCRSVQWSTTHPKVVVDKQPIRLASGLTVPVTIVSPGLPYGVVRAKDLQIKPTDSQAFSAAAIMLSNALTELLSLADIGMTEVTSEYHLMIVGELERGNAGHSATVTAACVSENGWVWSTPAGTGALSVLQFFWHRVS